VRGRACLVEIQRRSSGRLFQSPNTMTSPKYAAKLVELAAGYQRASMPDRARTHYQHALRILEGALGKTDPQTVKVRATLAALK